jgi:hypothetical protein
VTKLKKNGQGDGLLGLIGLGQGSTSALGNLTHYEAYICKAPEGCESHAPTYNKLHAYIGVKARAYDALVEIY